MVDVILVDRCTKLLNKLLEKATACHAWLNTKKDKPQKGLFIKCKKMYKHMCVSVSFYLFVCTFYFLRFYSPLK